MLKIPIEKEKKMWVSLPEREIFLDDYFLFFHDIIPFKMTNIPFNFNILKLYVYISKSILYNFYDFTPKNRCYA